MLGTELERWWLAFFFLYRRATSIIAAPYTATPPMAAKAMPTALALTGELELEPSPIGSPLLALPEELDDEPLPVEEPVDPSSGMSLARIGKVGSTKLVKKLIVEPISLSSLL